MLSYFSSSLMVNISIVWYSLYSMKYGASHRAAVTITSQGWFTFFLFPLLKLTALWYLDWLTPQGVGKWCNTHLYLQVTGAQTRLRRRIFIETYVRHVHAYVTSGSASGGCSWSARYTPPHTRFVPTQPYSVITLWRILFYFFLFFISFFVNCICF